MNHFLAGLLIAISGHHLAGICPAAGLVSNENFVVLAEKSAGDTRFARQLLRRADKFRLQVAREWLKEELPSGVGRTSINFRYSESQDKGLTWAIDDPRRTQHAVYLTTSRERALGPTLMHEIVHVVFATRFPHPHRLPAWVEEGIASRYDDDQRIARRDDIIRWIRQTGNWPDLQSLLERENIVASDQLSYAVASSLVDYLLTRGDKSDLLKFAVTGRRVGWNRALSAHYRIRGVAQFQQGWQTWINRQGELTLARNVGRR